MATDGVTSIPDSVQIVGHKVDPVNVARHSLEIEMAEILI